MSSEKVDEAKETEDSKPAPLQSVLKSKSKDAVTEETNKSKRVVFQEKPVIINKTVTKSVDSTKNEVVEVDKQKDKKDRTRPPTKVVVRRLPPSMTLDAFVEYVSPMPDHDFIYFVPADMGLGGNGFARVYINFLNLSDLITFHEQFDNYVFMDNKGNEYPAVVEFAQFQRIPKKRQSKKRDIKAGTLKDDQEYIEFLEILRERKEASAAKQTIDVIVPSDKPAPKITTTPLLEYIKQRRAEQQKLRDERREERRRKELERKRIKDEEKKRRKDAESVLKVLRSHDTEDPEDSKSGKDVKEKEYSPSPQGMQSNKRKEDEKLKQREEKKKEKPVVESRTREVKNRETGAKSYRDERQKLAEGRIQRKLADDQRKKGVIERNPNANKLGDTHQSQESEKPISSKDTHTRKSYVRDTESKRLSNERHNAKDEKNTRDPESRRSYRDSEGRRHDRYTYGKDSEHKRTTYSSEHRKLRLAGVKAQEKEARTKQVVDIVDEKVSTPSPDLDDENEQQKCEPPQSPERSNVELCISEAIMHKQKNKKFCLKRSNSVGSSTRSLEDGKEGKLTVDIKTDTVQSLKRSSSLDLGSVSIVHESRETDVNRETDIVPEEQNMSFGNEEAKEVASKHSSNSESSNSDSSNNCDNEDSSEEKENITAEQDAHSECETMQKNDHINTEGDSEKHRETEIQETEDSQNKETDGTQNATVSEQPSDENSQQNEDQMMNETEDQMMNETEDQMMNEKEDETMNEKEDQTMNDTKDTHNACVSSVSSSGHASANSSGSENKRDPRVERRIRNKDRPSIEIYRPGMGRFSMQRKEREKSAATTSSNVEQDSPSTSPSPSPSLRPISANRSRAGQELRSMTFKRSVSREK